MAKVTIMGDSNEAVFAKDFKKNVLYKETGCGSKIVYWQQHDSNEVCAMYADGSLYINRASDYTDSKFIPLKNASIKLEFE